MFYIKRAVVALGLVLALPYTVLGFNQNFANEFGLDGYETTLFEVGSQLRMIGS